MYKQIIKEPRINKKIRLNKAYDDVVKKGNIINIERLFPLDLVIDIIFNEIEPNILSHATISKNINKEIFKPFSFNYLKNSIGLSK